MLSEGGEHPPHNQTPWRITVDNILKKLLRQNLEAGMITQEQYDELTGPRIVRSGWNGKVSYQIELPSGTKYGTFQSANALKLLEILDEADLVRRKLREAVTRDSVNGFKFEE
jgi:hypothetical protein